MSLSPILIGLLTVKEAVEFVIYNKVAGGDLRIRVFFWPLGTVADVDVAVEDIKTRWFQTPLATVVELTRLQRAYNFEREL